MLLYSICMERLEVSVSTLTITRVSDCLKPHFGENPKNIIIFHFTYVFTLT